MRALENQNLSYIRYQTSTLNKTIRHHATVERPKRVAKSAEKTMTPSTTGKTQNMPYYIVAVKKLTMACGKNSKRQRLWSVISSIADWNNVYEVQKSLFFGQRKALLYPKNTLNWCKQNKTEIKQEFTICKPASNWLTGQSIGNEFDDCQFKRCFKSTEEPKSHITCTPFHCAFQIK